MKLRFCSAAMGLGTMLMAHAASAAVATGAALMLSPARGTTLASTSVTFNWTAGMNVTQYQLYVGNNVGAQDIFASVPGTARAVTVSGLPSDGRTLYVRLRSLWNGHWLLEDYTYKAWTAPRPTATRIPTATATNTPTPTATNTPTATATSTATPRARPTDPVADPGCPALPPNPPPSSYLSCTPDMPADTLRVKALLLIYDPTSGPYYGCRKMKGVYSSFPVIDDLVTNYVSDFDSASHGKVCIDMVQRYDVDGLPPAVVTSLDGPDGPMIRNHQWVSRDIYFHDLDHAISLRDGKAVDLMQYGGADYPGILNDPWFGIVDKVNAGTINTVFVIAPPMTGFWETAMAGPGAYWVNGPPIPGIASNKRFVVMYTGGDRDIGLWLHVTGHLAEWNITHYSASWPQTWAFGAATYNDWERFTLTQYANYNSSGAKGATDGGVAPGYAQLGTVHFPPNGTSNYDYNSAAVVSSYAPDWTRYDQWFTTPGYTPLAPVPVNKDTWGGMMPPEDDYGSHQRGFLYWWFSHLPAFAGQHGSVPNNWWPYIFDVNLPVAPAALGPVTAGVTADGAAPSGNAAPESVCVEGHVYPIVDGKVRFSK